MNEHQMFINLTKRGVINITKKYMNMNGERVHFRLNKHRAMIHKNTKHYIALNWSS